MSDLIGRTLGHYRVTAKLGEGGMGVVFRAHDERLDRDVAVKVLAESVAQRPDRLARFNREAKAVAKLAHPNILAIHHLGIDDDRPFIVTELLEGETLRQAIERGPLTPKKVIEFAIQIASGLAAAHDRNIIHRDLKPDNIFITSDGTIKILDFGLAKLKQSEDHDPAGCDLPTLTIDTHPGTVVGTAGYMSPEQVRSQPTDHRSDLFSMGAVLYEMLAGTRPFHEQSAAETMAAIAREDPPRLSQSGTVVPAALERVVNRCLEKRPDDRFQTARDLAFALQSILTDSAEAVVISGPALSVKPAAAKPRKVPAWVFWAPVAAAAVLFLFIILRNLIPEWRPAGPVVGEQSLVVLQFATTGDDEDSRLISAGLVETLTSKLTELERFRGSLAVVPASEVREAAVTSAMTAHRTFGVSLVISGSVQKAGSTVRLTANLIDAVAGRQLRAIDIESTVGSFTDVQDQLVRRVAEMLDIELNPEMERIIRAGTTSESDAYLLYLEGRAHLQDYTDNDGLEQAVSAFQGALQRDPQYALAYAGLGEACWRRWKLNQDTASMELAQSASRRAVELNDFLAPGWVTLGLVLDGTGKPEEAVDAFRRALALSPHDAEALRGLAKTFESLGRMEDAEATYRLAIEARPDSWANFNQLGVFFYRNGRLNEAEEALVRVTELAPENARAFSNLGGVYYAMGRIDDAVAAFRRAGAIEPSYRVFSNLATVQYSQGDYTGAAHAFVQSLALQDTDFRIWRNLASAYVWAPGLEAKAPAAYRRAAELAEEQRRVNPRDPEVLINLGDCYVALGRTAEGLDLMAEALELAPDDLDVKLFAANICEDAGDRDRALELLAEVLQRGFGLDQIASTPGLADLRADPRYKALVKAAEMP
jgi:serine/threonine-protein kinase